MMLNTDLERDRAAFLLMEEVFDTSYSFAKILYQEKERLDDALMFFSRCLSYHPDDKEVASMIEWTKRAIEMRDNNQNPP